MDLLESFRTKLDDGQSVRYYNFESSVYVIVPEKNGDYHFCELIAKLLAEQGQREEGIMALCGDMPKYHGTA